MAVTTLTGKKFIQVALDSSGGDWEMDSEFIIREIRVTGLSTGDYIVFYEANGDNPRIAKLDSDKAATIFQGCLRTKIGFLWDECSISSPVDAIISIELE